VVFPLSFLFNFLVNSTPSPFGTFSNVYCVVHFFQVPFFFFFSFLYHFQRRPPTPAIILATLSHLETGYIRFYFIRVTWLAVLAHRTPPRHPFPIRLHPLLFLYFAYSMCVINIIALHFPIFCPYLRFGFSPTFFFP